MEQGIEQGIEQGMALGRGEGEVALLTRLLGYADLPGAELARIHDG